MFIMLTGLIREIQMFSKLRFLAPLILTIASFGCSVNDLPFVYKVEVQQGNLLTEDDLDKVEIGMSKRQITYLIGSPNVIDPFHQDRWEYIFTLKPGRGDYKENKVTFVFDKEDKLTKIIGKGVSGDFITTD